MPPYVRSALRLAIAGLGWAGTRQVEALRELGGRIALDCVVDSSATHLAERARELGIPKTYTDYEAALDDPAVDAVSICTPHRLHAPMAVMAAQAGKHVLVEKPMATSVADATKMIEAATSNGVGLFVAESAVYEPRVRLLRELVQRGKYIGELTFAAVIAGYRAPNPQYPDRRAWLTQPELGGTGTWMLNGIHAAAQCRHVLGEVRTVFTHEHKASSFERADLEGTMNCLLVMESGIGACLVHTPETPLHSQASIQLYGDRGIVFGWKDRYEVYERRAIKGPQSFEYPQQRLSPYAMEMEAFADYIAGVGESTTDGVSERRSLAIIEAGLESAHTHRPVYLMERFGKL